MRFVFCSWWLLIALCVCCELELCMCVQASVGYHPTVLPVTYRPEVCSQLFLDIRIAGGVSNTHNAAQVKKKVPEPEICDLVHSTQSGGTAC